MIINKYILDIYIRSQNIFHGLYIYIYIYNMYLFIIIILYIYIIYIYMDEHYTWANST